MEEGEPLPKKKKILSEVENEEGTPEDTVVKNDKDDIESSEKPDEAIENDDKVDDKVNGKEDDIEDTIDDKVDNTDDDKDDNKVEEKDDSKDEDTVDDNVEDKVDENVEDKVDDKVEDKVTDKEDDKDDDNDKEKTGEDVEKGEEEEEEEGVKIDNEEDRNYSEKLVGEKIRGNYETGWHTGTIQWFNTKLMEYNVLFEDGSDDYITTGQVFSNKDGNQYLNSHPKIQHYVTRTLWMLEMNYSTLKNV